MKELHFPDAGQATVQIRVPEGVVYETTLTALYFICKYAGDDEWFTAEIPGRIDEDNIPWGPIRYRVKLERVE